MEQRPSLVRNIPVFVAALTIIVGTLVVSKVVAYEYINPKLFALQLGGTLVIITTLLIFPLAIWKKALHQPLTWGILGWLLTLSISAIASHDSVLSWLGDVDRGTGVVFVLIVGTAAIALGSVATKRQMLKYLYPSTVITGLALIASIIAERHGVAFFANAGDGGYLGNSSIAGTYLLITFFVSLYKSITSRGMWRWVYGVTTVVFLCNPIFINYAFSTYTNLFSLVGNAKGALFSTLFGGVIAASVWAWTSKKVKIQLLGKGVFITAVIVVLMGIVALARPTTGVHAWFVKEETNARFIYWDIALKGFHAHPLFGSGPETYSYTYQTYFNPASMLKVNAAEVWSNKPHNAYLQSLTETGIIGTAGYALLLVCFVLSLLKMYRAGRDRTLLITLSGMFAAYLLNNVIFFDTLTSYFLFFMVAAAIMASTPYTQLSLTPLRGEKWIRIGKALVLAIIVWCVAFPEIKKAHRAYEEFTLPLEARALWYKHVENTSPYGSGLFLAKRADFTFQSVYMPSLNSILKQTDQNKAIAVTAIQSLMDTIQSDAVRYPPNEQGELSLGRLASLKIVILNHLDADALATMEAAGETAIALSPTNPQGYLLLGQAYVYAEQYDKAYVQFDKARALEPQLPDPHHALINLAVVQHDPKKIAFYTQRAVAESPEFVQSLGIH